MDGEIVVCQYFRAVLEPGVVFSVPRLDMPEADDAVAAIASPAQIVAALQAPADGAIPVDATVFFDAINLNPSARVSHQSAGAAADPADIIVRIFPEKKLRAGTWSPCVGPASRPASSTCGHGAQLPASRKCCHGSSVG